MSNHGLPLQVRLLPYGHLISCPLAYTPENYTVHFGNTSGSLTPFNQQRQSGDNFTATNLQFSLQLTGLAAGTTYYYQVVAVNSVGSTASVKQSFTTTTLRKLAKGHIQVVTVDREVYLRFQFLR